MNVSHPSATLAVRRRIGFVDVAYFEGFGVQDFAVDLKFFRNLFKLFFLVRHMLIKILSAREFLQTGGVQPQQHPVIQSLSTDLLVEIQRLLVPV
jgi:hypothetical protein